MIGAEMKGEQACRVHDTCLMTVFVVERTCSLEIMMCT